MISKGKDKILIFSSTFGEGHQQAAYAIREAARLHDPKMEVVILDFMAWAHPFLYPIGHYMYMKGIKAFPSLYGYVFQKTRKNKSSVLKFHSLISYELQRMLHLLQEIKPTVIVSTFPYTAFIISKLKEYNIIDIPSVTVVTDYTDHSYWIHSYTDQYIVGSQFVREALYKRGVEGYKIADTGIPIRPEFAYEYSRKSIMQKHGLDKTLPTILVMGGGYGIMGNVLSIVEELNSFPKTLQFLIICGHNNKLRNMVEDKLRDSKHHIFVTGYIDYVYELMAISDLILTKPGGVTISEAMAMGLPMLLFNALPGQEQDNVKFLVQAGLAMEAKNIRDLYTKLTDILCNPIVYKTMKKKAKQYHRKQAAFDALSVILQVSKQEISPLPKFV